MAIDTRRIHIHKTIEDIVIPLVERADDDIVVTELAEQQRTKYASQWRGGM